MLRRRGVIDVQVLGPMIGLVLAGTLAGRGEAAGLPLHAINSGGAGPNFLCLVDSSDATVSTLGPIGFTADGLAFSPTGRLFVADNSGHRLLELSVGDGSVLQTIGPFGTNDSIEALAFHPTTGELWGVDVHQDQLVKIDTLTGAVQAVAPLALDGVAGLTWSLSGDKLYAIDCFTRSFVRVNPTTGAETQIGTVPLQCPLGLTTHPSDGRIFTVDLILGSDAALYTVSPVDAASTLIGTTVGADQLEGIAFAPNPGAYGRGCPGSGGLVPTLSTSSNMLPAQAQIAITVSDALGGSSAHVFFGLSEGALPMGGGCTLNVSPLLPASLVLPLGGVGPGTGTATLAGVLPAGAAGLAFTMQAFVIDPQGALGFANSNGLRIDVL